MRRLKFFFFLTLLNVCAHAQPDSSLVPSEIRDGIYLSYQDFRRDDAIRKEDVITPLDKEQLELMGKLMNEEQLTFRKNGQQQSVDPGTIWGFFQNKTLYVNYKEEFYRVPVFGSICYLVASVTVYNTGFYDPMIGYPMGGSRSKEIREFVMNFYDGQVLEFKADRVEELLSRDVELYREFKELSRRQRREQIYRYVRKYNDRHPVYFLQR